MNKGFFKKKKEPNQKKGRGYFTTLNAGDVEKSMEVFNNSVAPGASGLMENISTKVFPIEYIYDSNNSETAEEVTYTTTIATVLVIASNEDDAIEVAEKEIIEGKDFKLKPGSKIFDNLEAYKEAFPKSNLEVIFADKVVKEDVNNNKYKNSGLKRYVMNCVVELDAYTEDSAIDRIPDAIKKGNYALDFKMDVKSIKCITPTEEAINESISESDYVITRVDEVLEGMIDNAYDEDIDDYQKFLDVAAHALGVKNFADLIFTVLPNYYRPADVETSYTKEFMGSQGDKRCKLYEIKAINLNVVEFTERKGESELYFKTEKDAEAYIEYVDGLNAYEEELTESVSSIKFLMKEFSDYLYSHGVEITDMSEASSTQIEVLIRDGDVDDQHKAFKFWAEDFFGEEVIIDSDARGDVDSGEYTCYYTVTVPAHILKTLEGKEVLDESLFS